jgi:Asp/Glu/hydantoin racemase
VRIWFQGLVPRVAATAPYYASMERHAKEIAAADTVVEFRGLPPSLYPEGSSPAVLTRYIAGELVEAANIAACAIEAEESGADAFAIVTLQEPGLQAARTLVNIPVVGYGLAASLMARCLGSRVGILAFNPTVLPLMKERLEHHVPGSVGPTRDLGVGYDDTLAAFGTSSLRERFDEGCRALIRDGADVIVAGQMILAELAWSMGAMRIDDVPVVDALGAVVLLSQDLHRLGQVSGVRPNQRGIHWAHPSPEARAMITTAVRR